MFEEAVCGLIEIGAGTAVVRALRDKRLNKSSNALAIDTAFIGQPRTQKAVSELIQSWNLELPSADEFTIASLIECLANLQRRERERVGSARLVWTGPIVPGVYPRTSRQIVLELIASARREIWLTAYWIAGISDGEGIVSDIIDLLAQATERGLDVAIALDGRMRSSGETNFSVLMSLWPQGKRVPRLYTWAGALSEPHLKLHAKTLVIDRREALVTSANFTMHALERSMELGVRLGGELAAEIAAQFDGLVRAGVFVAVPAVISHPD